MDVGAQRWSRPAAMAATNMSPERRVSWPTTMAPPGSASWCAVARPSANARVGLRSTFATPRMPSVPKSRAMRSGLPTGDWDAAGDAEGEAGARSVTVTSTVSGLVSRPGSARRAGSRSTSTAVVPGREAGDVEVHDQGGRLEAVEVGDRPADGREDAVDVDRVVEVGALADELDARLERPGRRDRAEDVTLTDTPVSPIGTTPVGRSRAASVVRVLDAPLIETGIVLTLTSVLSWSASPSTVTTVGVTVTVSTSNPGAGVPVMTGFTGSVRDWRSENTGSVTWTNARREVHRADPVPDAVDRDEVDVLVDVDAGLLDDDGARRLDDLVDQRLGPLHRDLLRLDVHDPDGQPGRRDPLLDLDGHGPLGELVELDVHVAAG